MSLPRRLPAIGTQAWTTDNDKDKDKQSDDKDTAREKEYVAISGQNNPAFEEEGKTEKVKRTTVPLELQSDTLAALGRVMGLADNDEQRMDLLDSIYLLSRKSIPKERVNGFLTEKTIGQTILSGALLVQSLKYVSVVDLDANDRVLRMLFGLHILSICLQILTILLLIVIGVYNYDTATSRGKFWLMKGTHVATGLIAILMIIETTITGLQPYPSPYGPPPKTRNGT